MPQIFIVVKKARCFNEIFDTRFLFVFRLTAYGVAY